ncbi:hypothetical protein [Piscinibacter koreensis]|uniref:Uncharacterized protein n=1 Tax=Piscinibacter koreensis TaxID=2742824 RepID=A0A7Y6NMW4_9BURK|nr:hypothetical protein [Schlegelella koreensis]NUZ06014.1 hypothetical protein [Schlegelella koreensis]
MPTIPRALTNTLTTGSAASLLSLLMLALGARREAQAIAAPMNAISHWFYGKRAYTIDDASLKHTGVGVVVHHLSALVWGALFEAVLKGLAKRRRPVATHIGKATKDRAPVGGVGAGPLLVGAAAVTAVAALTDLKLVPERLTPGFENRLRPGSVALVYVAFAAGLAIAAAAARRD